MRDFKLSRFNVMLPIGENGRELLALYNTLTQGFVLVPMKAWASLRDGSQTDLSATEFLMRQGFLVRDGVNENAVYANWKQQHVHKFSTIMSKVLVTRQCNNRCSYCIIDEEAKRMDRETALAMDNFYLQFIKEKSPRRVEDIYSGGEVLLNIPAVLDSAARRHYFCMGKGVEYGFSIITNGTIITPGAIALMKRVGLTGIKVSLAGPAPIHDKLRPSKNNGGTFDVIVRNLRAISGQTPITIQTQYDSASEDYLRIPEMMDYLLEADINVENIFFTPILPRRRRCIYHAGMGNPEIYLYLIKEAQKRGFPQLTEAPSNACMADFRARLVFDADGSITPCGSLQCGERAYGHVTGGIDFVAESQLLQRTLPERCLNECDLLPLCHGGCRLNALTRENDFNSIDCNFEALNLVLKEYMREKAAASLSESR